MRTEAPRPVRLQDYRPPDYLIDEVFLNVRLSPDATHVEARLEMRPNPNGSLGAPLVMNGEDLELEQLSLDGMLLSCEAFTVGGKTLTIPAPPKRPFSLTVSTRISPAQNTQLMGLYLSNGTYCTQCEAEGFRRITYFLDRPDVLSVYTTRIEAQRVESPVLLSNGELIQSGAIDGTDRHYAVWHDPVPKPCYLYALVGGDLACVEDSFRTASGRDVALRIYVEHGKEDRCAYAMDALKRAMRWDEEAFGREYDLGIFMVVAVSYFNMGAMENKGLNIFNDKYVLARPETATDSDYAGIEAVIAHEYFHNWTGNRITCRDWFQLCLKEGLTVFRDQEFSSDMRSRAVERIADVRALRVQQFAEDAGPLAHPVRPQAYSEINNFYTATVYEKGAEVIRVLRTLIGAEDFRRGIDLYFERCDGTAATVEDFVACFAEATGRDLAQFMLWYEQAGTPELDVTSVYDASAGTYTMNFEQVVPPTPGQPKKEPMVIPVAMGLLGPGGLAIDLKADRDAALKDDVLTLTREKHVVTFRDVRARPVPSLLRGFSAPVKLRVDLEPADLLFLIRNDTDLFNRWQAGQDYALRLLIETARGRAHSEESVAAFASAQESLLSDHFLEPAFVSQALALPSEIDIAREIGSDVDPDSVHSAREALRAALGRQLRETLAAKYQALGTKGAYSPDAASAGRRDLRKACLDLLSSTRADDTVEMVERHFHNADNMTDRIAALGIVSRIEGAARERTLALFRERYRDDPLVLDKWFGLQATAPGRPALDRVRRLMGDPAFSLSNPNRVRSLIGSFAIANPPEFNRPDGAGYEFVVDIVLELDPKNPQVAARLLSAFRSWRALEPIRRHKAEAALRRVLAAETLSPDVADIANRCLQ